MSKDSLKQIGQVAERLRKDSTEHHVKRESLTKEASEIGYSAGITQNLVESHQRTLEEYPGNEDAAQGLEEEQASRDKLVFRAGEAVMNAAMAGSDASTVDSYAWTHYKQNEAAYHDLAVMDAHLDGVKINVEQPIEAGQKIDVHIPEHQ